MVDFSVARIDKLLEEMDVAYKAVLDAQGKPVKLPSAELNLLSIIGNIRDAFATALRQANREILEELFGGTCKRVAHVRALLDVLELSPMNASDQRLRGGFNACLSVKDVLVDMGLAEVLQEAEEQEREVLEKEVLGREATTEVAAVAPAAEALTAEAPAEEARMPPPEAAPPAAAEEDPLPAAPPALADAAEEKKDGEAGMDTRPPLATVVEEEWSELMGVKTCKVGCGRRCAPGVTKSGKGFDTCCRGCALGRPHYRICGLVDPAKVGKGLCKNGCGRPAAKGKDSLGFQLDTCCRGCANGEAHNKYCTRIDMPETDRTRSSVIVVDDERTFFMELKSTLKFVEFNQFLDNCRLLNRKRQTLDETLACVQAILGKENAALYVQFERLVRKRMRELVTRKGKGSG